MKKIIIILTSITLSVFFTSCYTEALDSLSTFKFQFIVSFDTEHDNSTVPDTSLDFSNLNEYPEYKDNFENIKRAEILHFNYWIDSLTLDGNRAFNPNSDYVEFEFIRYYLQFAVPRPGYIPGNEAEDSNPSNWIPDPTFQKHLLGEFKDVNIKDYYRLSHHILEVPESTALVISEALINRPQFFIITEYSETKGENPNMEFPYIKARYDVDIRFEVEL